MMTSIVGKCIRSMRRKCGYKESKLFRTRRAIARHLDLLLVLREGKEVVLLLAFHAAGFVGGALVVALHLTVILICLTPDTVPPCIANILCLSTLLQYAMPPLTRL